MSLGGSIGLIGNALTLGDILGCVRGVVTFAPVLLAPGYCLAWVCDFLGFRSRALGERLAWSVALSFGLMTIASVELGKYGSMFAVYWLAGLCAVGFLGLLSREIWQQPRGFVGRYVWLGSGVAAAWVLFVVLELVDVGVGNRLYLSITVFDHALRTAFVDAVMRTGVPPANPLYWPGHAAPMRYYYFWYVLAAAAARLGAVTARQAMIASVVWAGFGLAAVLTLFCRHFLSPLSSGSNGRRWLRAALALGLLGVTGLDILPALAKAILRLPTDADMDWWSPDQVSSWMDSLLWVPHHVAGLVCCLFGFLLVWMSKGLSNAQCAGCGLIAGLSFASAFGLSTWVAAAFAMVLLVWMVWALVWEPESRTRVLVLFGAGLVSVLALMPYLVDLREASTSATTTLRDASTRPVADTSIAGNASHLLRFGVRHMIDPASLLAVPWFAELARSHPRVEDAIAGLILLLPGYFLELGFFGLVLFLAVRAMRRAKLDEAVRASLVLAVAALIVASLLRSTVIANNDFGMRSILIAQFFLLLLAVGWCEGAFGATNRSIRSVMLAMMWIGVAGTVYQAIGLRLYLPVEDKLGRQEVRGLGERAMALRRGFDAMDGRVPRDAIVQYDTAQPSDYFRYAQVMQVGRQTATAFPECNVAFGGEISVCAGVQQGVARLFTTEVAGRIPIPGGALSGAGARVECGKLGVSYLVATRWDNVWLDSGGWVWTLPAVVDTGDVRVLNCTETPRTTTRQESSSPRTGP